MSDLSPRRQVQLRADRLADGYAVEHAPPVRQRVHEQQPAPVLGLRGPP
ncbi:hypothetical protein RKD48_001614 [Streptomyces ambofaciens]